VSQAVRARQRTRRVHRGEHVDPLRHRTRPS
jgi:hypothetical protein